MEIDPIATRIRFTSSFDGVVRLSLTSPDGTVYGPNGAGPVAAYAVGDGSEVYEISAPTPGTWTISAASADPLPEGQTVALSVLMTEGSPPATEISPVADAGGSYVARVGDAITFTAADSFDPDGHILQYEWDFQNDGTVDFTSPSATATHIYQSAISGTVWLRVTDSDGQMATDTAPINVSYHSYLPAVASP